MIKQISVFIILLYSFIVNSQQTIEQQKLLGSTIGNYSYFGVKHDSHQDSVVIGAMYHKHNNQTDAGAAFVFRRNTNGQWIEEGYLTASDAVESDTFGRAVGIHGDVIIIGAPWAKTTNSEFTGKAYVFEKDQDAWQESQIINFPDGTPLSQSQFGISVAANNQFIMISAPGAINQSTNNRGALYIYKKINSSWTQVQKLYKEDTDLSPIFGTVLFTDNDRLIVAAGSEEDAFENSRGVAYSYHLNNQNLWEFEEKIWAPADTDLVNFSGINAASKNKVFVYSNTKGSVPEYAGQIHVFKKEGVNWVPNGIIRPAVSKEAKYFGFRFHATDNAFIASAEDYNIGAEMTKLSYYFQFHNNQWVEKNKLIPSALSTATHFGSSITIAAHDVFIGSYLEDTTGTQSGASYVFNLDKLFSNDFD